MISYVTEYKTKQQINDINEMFEEKINIDAEPIDDFFYFLN